MSLFFGGSLYITFIAGLHHDGLATDGLGCDGFYGGDEILKNR